MEKIGEIKMDDFIGLLSSTTEKKVKMVKDFCTGGYRYKKVINLMINDLKVKLVRPKKSDSFVVKVTDSNGKKRRYKMPR
ncbi:MAG: hypothetical protein WC926_04925 [Candidatus Paceibacterota bacterium]|jgi:hypothetical protein